MVKVRLNTADVAAEVKCLRRLIGMRCSNVYDLTPKTYIFKLMNSSGVTESGESEKVLLLMESGVRLHTTAYVRDKSNTPSGFTLKLRKHIRTRRLEDVRQLGYDRIILFQFGLGANAHYVILELYAQGNIILTDSEFMVLTLLRSHRDDDKGVAIMSRHLYPTEICRHFERTTISKLHTALASSGEPDENEATKGIGDGNNSLDAPKGNEKGKKGSQKGGQKGGKPSESNKSASDNARAKQATLKNVLGEALGYGPALAEHIILDAGLASNTKVTKDNKLDDDKIQALAQAVEKFEDWLQDVISGEKIPEGYILMQKKNSGKDGPPSEGTTGQMYDECCPILLNQFKSRAYVNFETFDAALDEFYSKIESQRAEQQQKTKESTASQKLNKIRLDQENRVHMLKKEVDNCVRMAELIEYNLEDVDAAILAVRVALAKGMSWEDLARMVKEEKKSGNPVAGVINQLHLERNCMTLLLSNNLDEMDDDEKTLPADKVEVDLALSAHANARRWYGMKKKQESKQEKTIVAHEKAFKAAERKTRLQLSQEKTVATITHMRKVHWFEKFNWFISSENYLVISGRDAQQNEMIVKRYMSKGDLYVHADLHGASSTIIKNHRPEQPVPPLTLNQAGCFTVCHSQAWDSKIVTSAWWVYPQQGEGEEEGINEAEESGPPIENSESESEKGGEATDVSEVAAENSTGSNDVGNAIVSDLVDSGVASVSPQLEALLDHALVLGSANLSGKSPVLETSQNNLAEEGNHEEKTATVKEKPHISKAERRKLKKGTGSTAATANTEKGNGKTKENLNVSGNNSKPGGGKISRGQRGKLKKIKEKYADQDEEEKSIRMALLASSGKANKNEGSDDGKTTTSNDQKANASGSQDAPKICYKCKKVGHLSRDCPEHPDATSHHATGVEDDRRSGLDDTSELDRVAMEEDDVNEIGEEEKGRLNDVDYLTGNPLPSDILLYAVPVCGPYSAVQSYKYRVKIVPGTAKKGKAAKTAMNLFTHMAEASSREKELMKACTDPELVAAIVGNVKITAAGLTQLKQKQKKSKKSSNKGES
ncbi:hypothetical protein F3Y22_tig00002841pilonHSYRG00092 [Hibiscus syriacus]|uniref:CCHC-type domain-containing protein n=1 Tax=Hibiscus syriacus TaxID=106335 RepID=A0A6A3CUM2_HIBSY|nr:hypothetical protein F3Y22_tig00002841pilonHSYRG00092 [Hibiscus syriacus]